MSAANEATAFFLPRHHAPLWAVYRVNVHLMGAKDAIKNSFTVDDNVCTGWPCISWAASWQHSPFSPSPPISPPECMEDRVACTLEARRHRGQSSMDTGGCGRLSVCTALLLPTSLLQRTWALLEGTEDRVAWALEAVGLWEVVARTAEEGWGSHVGVTRGYGGQGGGMGAGGTHVGATRGHGGLSGMGAGGCGRRTWALLEGTEDRVAWALEAVGLKHLSREPASILSMGQVSAGGGVMCQSDAFWASPPLFPLFSQHNCLLASRHSSFPLVLDEPSVGPYVYVTALPPLLPAQLLTGQSPFLVPSGIGRALRGASKRLQLARFLAIPRSLWPLDEPSGGLDLAGVELLEGMIEEHRGAGGIAFRKRLQLARLLAIPRSLWLLDEPSVGLDLAGVELLEGMIEEHRGAGGIAFVATHTPIQLSSCFHLRFPVRCVTLVALP
ncbi:unnamed protein product [Closterium sp. NIES-65]|nr:unnamed protein product [Closterium sp. NIES-65]